MAYPPSHDRCDLTTAQDLTVTVTIQRGDVVVRAVGVLDDGGAARVLAAVHCARQVSPTFTVDLSGLTGAVPRGARVLTHWWREVATNGSTPLVIAPADAGLLPEVGSARCGDGDNEPTTHTAPLPMEMTRPGRMCGPTSIRAGGQPAAPTSPGPPARPGLRGRF